MIFDTLAAMADYRNNLKFDLTATTAECKTEMLLKNAAGQFTMKDETLTVDGRTVTVNDANKLQYILRGLLVKTPLQTLNANLAPYSPTNP